MSSASIMLNLKPNFLKSYLTNSYDFMLEVLFRTTLLFWYIKKLPRSFSFWDTENVKHKFQAIYTYKKSVWNVKKGIWLLRKLILETFLPNLISNLPPICKINFRKALF